MLLRCHGFSSRKHHPAGCCILEDEVIFLHICIFPDATTDVPQKSSFALLKVQQDSDHNLVVLSLVQQVGGFFSRELFQIYSL